MFYVNLTSYHISAHSMLKIQIFYLIIVLLALPLENNVNFQDNFTVDNNVYDTFDFCYKWDDVKKDTFLENVSSEHFQGHLDGLSQKLSNNF